MNIKLRREESRQPILSTPQYVLISLGPDYIRGPDATGQRSQWTYGAYAEDPLGTDYYIAQHYDASNGTKSPGDILMWP